MYRSPRPSQLRVAGALIWASVCVFAACALGDADRGARAEGLETRSAWQRTRQGWLLRAPDPGDAVLGPKIGPVATKKKPMYALAYHYDARVFDTARDKARVIGSVRRGTLLSAAKQVRGKGCRRGIWYALKGIGYACTRDGFLVSNKPPQLPMRQLAPALDAALPFQYARVIVDGALRFVRIPHADELSVIASRLAAAEAGSERVKLPNVVQAQMVGDYFVALDRVEGPSQQPYYRTVRGRYVRVGDIEPRAAPKMQGVLLSGARALPYAFVYGEDDAPLLKLADDDVRPAGRAEVHARFAVKKPAPSAHPELVSAPHNVYVPRDRVRIARRIARPSDVPRDAKWVHVELSEQTLVAYEGDKPVFATLVSTGKEPGHHATPTGLYRIRDKRVTVTMSGDDPVDGHYEVAEVPWTQFYNEGYALHGAYWHDTFGKTRSHGCTNLSPPDARWLFQWTLPRVPKGMHALRGEGTYVYFTRTSSTSGSG